MIPTSTIEAIKAATDLPSLAREYGLKLIRSGDGYVAQCCFHSERTPSLRIHAAGERKGTYMCFGCGAKGNSLSFVMALESWPFRRAVEHLAERAGIRIDSKPMTRVQCAIDLEDRKCSIWWWARKWDLARTALDESLNPLDEDWADTCSRLLLAVQAVPAAERLQEFRCHVTNQERAEWRSEVAEAKRFADAWMSLATPAHLGVAA